MRRIEGERRSGKTTMAIGFLERLQRQGVSVVYIAPTIQEARDCARTTDVKCIGWSEVNNEFAPDIRAVVIDGSQRLPRDHAEKLELIKWQLRHHLGPTQIIFVN